jgi:cytochrome d ubiquinol oxidase subunit II
MSDFFASIGLPEIIAGLIVLALNAYALMGGADFGGGVWDLLASGQRRDEQRALISAAIAPIWEANHVWLIVAVVMLFTAFPTVFGMLSVVLHIPLTLMLVGIVLRGSAFVFRSYGSHSRADRRRWGRLFAIASTVTPFVLGDIVGALSSGAVSDASQPCRAPHRSAACSSRRGSRSMRCRSARFALALFSFLAAVYLTVAARDALVREDFRKRALASAAAVFVTALGALVAARSQAPEVGQGLTAGSLALGVHVATGVAAVVAVRGARHAPVSARPPCGGSAGVAHPVGLGVGAVPVHRAARRDDPGGGGAEQHARAARMGAGGWSTDSDPSARLPVPHLQRARPGDVGVRVRGQSKGSEYAPCNWCAGRPHAVLFGADSGRRRTRRREGHNDDATRKIGRDRVL